VWKKSGAWFFKGMPKSEEKEEEEVVVVNHRRERYQYADESFLNTCIVILLGEIVKCDIKMQHTCEYNKRQVHSCTRKQLSTSILFSIF